MRRKAAILLYPDCIFFEIALAAEALAHSMEVLFYTPDGAIHSSSMGALIYPSGSYAEAEADVETLSTVLVPGGDPGSIIPSAKATPLLQSARRHGAVVGGICGGVLVLASAGLLQGVRATHNYTSEFAGAEKAAFTRKYWEDVIYVRADVVTDQNIITAMPWAYVEFAAEVALGVGAMNSTEASLFISRYRRATRTSNG